MTAPKESVHAPLLLKLGFTPTEVVEDQSYKEALEQILGDKPIFIIFTGTQPRTVVTDETGRDWYIEKEVDLSEYGFVNALDSIRKPPPQH